MIFETKLSDSLNSVTSGHDNMGITIGWNPLLLYQEGFNRLYNTIIGLSNWMNVSISDVKKSGELHSAHIAFKPSE